MANQEYEYPTCWIRGEMSHEDYDNDPVRNLIQKCSFRKGKGVFGILGHRTNYKCTHPAILEKNEVEGAREAYGGIVAGGLSDDYATFCEAVDMHLTSLGEKSRLIYDATFTDADDDHPLLGSGQ